MDSASATMHSCPQPSSGTCCTACSTIPEKLTRAHVQGLRTTSRVRLAVSLLNWCGYSENKGPKCPLICSQVAEDVGSPGSAFPSSTCLGMVLLRPPPGAAVTSVPLGDSDTASEASFCSALIIPQVHSAAGASSALAPTRIALTPGPHPDSAPGPLHTRSLRILMNEAGAT
jgi:hypothetical protein